MFKFEPNSTVSKWARRVGASTKAVKMSQAELVKQCKVKTGIVKRLHKEVDHYRKEEQHEQARVDKMKAAGADKFDLKQAVSTVLRDGPQAAFR